MQFDDDVPPPATRESRAKVLSRMQIGESFTIPKGEAASWRSAMSKASETGTAYFVSRTWFDGSIRIWRKA